jgi:hypothetical protein
VSIWPWDGYESGTNRGVNVRHSWRDRIDSGPAHDLVDRIPTAGLARPVVDPDYIATIGLARDEARALVAAADADCGPRALRMAAVRATHGSTGAWSGHC